MIKEEIEAQLALLTKLYENFRIHEDIFEEESELLDNEFTKAKSIQNLQEEAFEAGRKQNDGKDVRNPYLFETFDDYLIHIIIEKSIHLP